MPRLGIWFAFAFTAFVLCSCFDTGASGNMFPWPTAGRCLSSMNNALSLRPLMNAPDCSDPLVYQYDLSRFDPDLEESNEPSRQWATVSLGSADAAVNVEVEELSFSTKLAAESDPQGLAQFPETYRYNEYRVSVRPEYGIKAIGISSVSLGDAFSKAQALCVKRSPVK